MLSLTPGLLSGNGTVRIKDAEMDSKGFKFKRRTFDALIANFRIKSYDLNDLTISTKNYQTHLILICAKVNSVPMSGSPGLNSRLTGTSVPWTALTG